MKKHLPYLLYSLLSCLTALAVFSVFPFVALDIAEPDIASEITFEDSDGDVLEFMGESLYISRETIDKIIAYPGTAAEFALSFMPVTVRDGIKCYFERVNDSGKAFWDNICHILYTLLSIGT